MSTSASPTHASEAKSSTAPSIDVAPIAKYSDIRRENVVMASGSNACVKLPVPPPGTGDYWLQNIFYNFGDAKSPNIGAACIELCEVEAELGVATSDPNKVKKDKKGAVQPAPVVDPSNPKKPSTYMYITYNNNNPSQMACARALNEFYMGVAAGFTPVKAQAVKPHFDEKNPAASMFKSMVIEPLDDLGKPIPGRASHMYLKPMERIVGNVVIGTTFSQPYINPLTGKPGLKPIPIDYLKGVTVKFIPVVEFSQLYIGAGTMSIRHILKSAIVTGIRAISNIDMQLKSAEELVMNDPEIIARMEKQMAEMSLRMKERKEIETAKAIMPPTASATSLISGLATSGGSTLAIMPPTAPVVIAPPPSAPVVATPPLPTPASPPPVAQQYSQQPPAGYPPQPQYHDPRTMYSQQPPAGYPPQPQYHDPRTMYSQQPPAGYPPQGGMTTPMASSYLGTIPPPL